MQAVNNNNEPVVTPIKAMLGKRGFIANDGVTTTVTVVRIDVDEKVPGAIEVITRDGQLVICNVSEVTFDEPADEPEEETPPAAAPAPVPAAAQSDAPKAMTIRDTQVSSILDPNTYIQMKALSKDFFDSKVVPSAYQNVLQVLFGIQAGYEMGMQPIESLQSITFVNGNMSVWGKAVPRRLRAHGWSLAFEEGTLEGKEFADPKSKEDAQYCKATITRGDETYTDTVTFGDARESGYTLDSKGNLKPGWKPGLNRKLKLRYDVLDVLCKTYVPEVFGGTAGTAEVLQDVNIIEGETAAPSMKDKIAAARGKLDTKAKAKDVIDQ